LAGGGLSKTITCFFCASSRIRAKSAGWALAKSRCFPSGVSLSWVYRWESCRAYHTGTYKSIVRALFIVSYWNNVAGI